MSDSEFGLELSNMETAAKYDFPLVADIYGNAIGNCNLVGEGLAQVMRRPAEFGGDFGPVYWPYLELHRLVVGFLTTTQTNLDDIATALDKAVRYFLGTDQAAADAFNSLGPIAQPKQQPMPGTLLQRVGESISQPGTLLQESAADVPKQDI